MNVFIKNLILSFYLIMMTLTAIHLKRKDEEHWKISVVVALVTLFGIIV